MNERSLRENTTKTLGCTARTDPRYNILLPPPSVFLENGFGVFLVMCGLCNSRDRGVSRVGHAGWVDVSPPSRRLEGAKRCLRRGRLPLFDVGLAS